MPIGAIAAVGGGIVSNIIGGIAGQQAGAGDRGKAHDAMILSMEELQKIGMPPDEAKAIVYQQFQQKGLMTPELEQHIEQTASGMKNVTGSQPAQQAQLQALQALQQRGQAGLTPEDRAALNQVRGQVAADTEGKRQQILQNFAARGQGGSGAELISALQASQSGANAESQAGDRLAALASQNALQSIGQAGTLGGQIQQQQFGEQAAKAQAQDVINQFNTQNAVQQQARNVAAGNQAQGYNLGVGQQVANANTQQANQELLRQNQAQRQQWLDSMERQKVLSGGYQQEAGNLNASAQAAAQSAAAPWTAIGAGLTTVGGAMMKGSAGGGGTNNAFASTVPGTGMGAVKSGTYDDRAVDPANSWHGGEIKSKYNDGGRVKEPHFLSDKPIEDIESAEGTQSIYGGHESTQEEIEQDKHKLDKMDPIHKAKGGMIPSPHIDRLKKIFPHTSEDSLRDIHTKLGSPPAPIKAPSMAPRPPMGSPRLQALLAPMPTVPMRPQMHSDGGGVRQPDEHFMRSGTTDYREGGHVPGEAPVPGDSPQNDIVDAKLSPGEYVMKRSDAKSPFGKKLIKLLEAHHEVMKHDKGE